MRVTLDLLHEFANTEIFGLFHNCMWQSRHPEVDVYFLELVDCCPPTYSRSQVRNVCRLPEHSNGTFVLSQQVALFCELDLGLVGWLGAFCLV